VQQAGAITTYLRRHCQSTALWLTWERQFVTLALTSMHLVVTNFFGNLYTSKVAINHDCMVKQKRYEQNSSLAYQPHLNDKS